MPSRPTRPWIGVIAVLQAAILLTLWGAGPAVTPALAQGIPDEGAQRERSIEQLKAVNTKLDRLITLLSEGKVEVTLRKAEDAGRNR